MAGRTTESAEADDSEHIGWREERMRVLDVDDRLVYGGVYLP